MGTYTSCEIECLGALTATFNFSIISTDLPPGTTVNLTQSQISSPEALENPRHSERLCVPDKMGQLSFAIRVYGSCHLVMYGGIIDLTIHHARRYFEEGTLAKGQHSRRYCLSRKRRVHDSRMNA